MAVFRGVSVSWAAVVEPEDPPLLDILVQLPGFSGWPAGLEASRTRTSITLPLRQRQNLY